MIATIIGIIILTGTVTYFMTRQRYHKVHSEQPAYTLQLQEFIKESNAFELSFDHCKFKDASYLSEVETRNADLELAATLVGTTAGYYTPVERVETIQSVLFYQQPEVCGGKRFYQTFHLDATTLKFHVLQGTMKLYVHRSDAEKYVFLVNQYV